MAEDTGGIIELKQRESMDHKPRWTWTKKFLTGLTLSLVFEICAQIDSFFVNYRYLKYWPFLVSGILYSLKIDKDW